MSSAKSRSKRYAFRFNTGGYNCGYKTEFEEGKGELLNISTGGCILRNAGTSLSVHQKLVLLLLLDGQEAEIEVGAEVVRVEDIDTAVKFTDVSEESKNRIVHFFARYQRRKGKRGK